MHSRALHRRGHLWLDFERNAKGEQVRANLFVFWYDETTRRVRRRSVGSDALEAGVKLLDELYLQHGSPDDASRATYSLALTLSDYLIEVAPKRVSADAIRPRLAHWVDFFDAEVAAGRPGLGIAPNDVNDLLTERFRAWSRLQPITWRNKAGEVTVSKPRSEATIEESVHQLKAAINHAVNKGRVVVTTRIASRTRSQVTPPNRDRLQIEQIAELFNYCLQPQWAFRREGLRRFLVASICTLCRPDAAFDISLAPARQQWETRDRILHLNPIGRQQTKKYRASVGVIEPLDRWLQVVSKEKPVANVEAAVTIGEDEQDDGPFFVAIDGRRVASVKKAWTTARFDLKLPPLRGSKIIRHSISTELRRPRYAVNPWELEGWLGHRILSTSEIYALFSPDSQGTVGAALATIVAEIERLSPGSFDPIRRP